VKEKLHIYCRVSSDTQEKDGTSLENQEKSGIRYSERLGLEPVIYNEGSQSSYSESIDERPYLQKLIYGIQTGEVKNIYTWNRDRLSRNETLWDELSIKFYRHGIIYYTEGSVTDYSDHTDRLMGKILSSFTSYENELRRTRTILGKLERVKRGGWKGGDPPYGYQVIEKKLVENPEESKWIKFIYESFRDGRSLRQIRSDLFLEGIKTRRGNDQFPIRSLELILRNSVYGGSWIYRCKETKEVVECFNPPILDKNLIHDVRSKINLRDRKYQERQPNQKNFYLLQNLIECGECGSNYSGRSRRKKKTYYCLNQERHRTPHKHDMRYINCDEFDKLIWDSSIKILEESHHWKQSEKERILEPKTKKDKDLRYLNRKIRDKKNDIKDIQESFVELHRVKKIDPKRIKESMKHIELRILEEEKELKKLENEYNNQHQVSEWINWVEKHKSRIKDLKKRTDLSEEEQKQFLRGLITKIKVKMINKKTHQIDILFTKPIVDDGYDRGKKKVIDGKKKKTIKKELVY
jgi:site-specific DNA recombinase